MEQNSTYDNTSTGIYYYYHETYGGWINPPFSYETFMIIELILAMAIIGIMSAFGIVSNSINLILFYRQGIMSHSCTVSLTALTLSDLFYSIIKCWGSVCLYLQLIVVDRWEINYRWSPDIFYAFTSLRPAFMLSDINCGVTAFIAFERLFSVTFPFKVKAVFTAKRSCAVLSCIVCGTFIYYIPNNFTDIPAWIWFEEFNSTRLTYTSNHIIPEEMVQFCIDTRVILRTSVAFFVLLCNIAISLKVILAKQFRKSTASTTTRTVSQSGLNPDSIKQNENKQDNSKKESSDASSYNENKEMKLLRMMMVLCVLFVISYIADFIFSLVFDFIGLEYMVDYHFYTYYLVLDVMFLFQTVNSSCNVFIYYNMSTRYREDFRLFLCNWKK